ncbi:MAG: putative Transposable element Tc3 transposase [Streblomastix strix]|uniref:Putative Transposable element Tc3 transposase n=1 Tax=Streblomastix strix TaxID=222440 RepID=A0A5J4W381_9EUKA|nr:MAG: putative Transposable element Tc3 transposase [Streblomastix strix]
MQVLEPLRVHLKAVKIRKRKVRRRPLLTKKHKENRIQFARKCLREKVDFNLVIFSDEEKLKLDVPDGYNYFWVGLEEKLDPVHYSVYFHKKKDVMVWLTISSEGIIHIERVVGSINSDTYSDMITNDVLAAFHASHGTDFIFQQDNTPAHVTKTAKATLSNVGIQLLYWPALSSDLNPVENIWSLIVRRLYTGYQSFNSEEQLRAGIQRVVVAITKEEVLTYIRSMKDRLLNVVQRQGLYVQ